METQEGRGWQAKRTAEGKEEKKWVPKGPLGSDLALRAKQKGTFEGGNRGRKLLSMAVLKEKKTVWWRKERMELGTHNRKLVGGTLRTSTDSRDLR